MGVEMDNRKQRVLKAGYEVRQALSELGLNESVVRRIAFAAAAGRASSIMNADPASAPGLLSYIYGVRQTRLELFPLGWRDARFDNVESMVNDELGIQLVFQNVIEACGVGDPEAISAKGAGARKLVANGQMELFARAAVPALPVRGTMPKVWLLCVSSNRDFVRAEVSCPEVFEGDQFEGFSSRILVVDESMNPQPDPKNDDQEDYGFDLDVVVSRK